MFRLVVILIIVFLIYLEVIPVKKWIFKAKVRLIGLLTRACLGVLGYFEKLLK